MKTVNKSGMAIVTVMAFIFILSALAGILVNYSINHVQIARVRSDAEIALQIAEAGIEHAGAHIATNGVVPASWSLVVGDGSYCVSIVDAGSIIGCSFVISGAVNINPNNRPDYEFSVTLPDSSQITRDNLIRTYPGYRGRATLVRVKPKGDGNQNLLMVDGQPFVLSNASTYDISSPNMSVGIYNDKVVHGEAKGHWWISIAATSAQISRDGNLLPGGGQSGGGQGQSQKQYSIVSAGAVRGQTRTIIVEGTRRKTWADFALWSDNNRDIYFKSGEKFYGRVHSNTALYFSGDPEFFEKVTSGTQSYGGNTNQVIFHKGFIKPVVTDGMADVDFGSLRNTATMIFTGVTYIAFSGTNMSISNSRRGWSSYVTNIPPYCVIYVASTSSGSDQYGDAYVAGVLDGRVSIVTERDILITNHIVYASDPKTNSASDDALGLISARDVVVTTSCPSNLFIYAHIMATGKATSSTTDGSFGVENFSKRPPSGFLYVHGGIVQSYRGAVGTFNANTGELISGYEKNYTFDERFRTDPPPEYPPLGNELIFGSWRDR